jgi:OOP family OmpA-OmpF porin
MTRSSLFLILAGAAVSALLAAGSTVAHGPALIGRIDREARTALDRAGAASITARFVTGPGWLTRHPVLSGGAGLDAETRGQAAQAVGAVPGVGGVSWAGRAGGAAAQSAAVGGQARVLHCQDDVEAILKARTIRFDEASAALDPASSELLDEVADALRPCVGSIIAISGHTDSGGDLAANLLLSRQRADAVRAALEARGIPGDGLRAKGLGAKEPLAGLDPDDPANRRIEFSVIATMPLKPTPVDTPGAG